MLREYFKCQDPDSMLEDLNNTENTERNNIQAALINSALTNFKNRINSVSRHETRFERPNEIVNIVEKILEFNRQHQGRGLKIVIPNQMLNRLPIFFSSIKSWKKFRKT